MVSLESIIPRPAVVEPAGDDGDAGSCFLFLATTVVAYEDGSAVAKDAAQSLAGWLRPALELELPTVPRALAQGSMVVLASADGGDAYGTHAEGYSVEVERERVLVRASTAAGFFYASQSLRQLLPSECERRPSGPGPWTLPLGRIADRPRFAWRGALLDIGRHFRDRESIKRFIDLLALHKLNVLHLHLTEDQGWRMEIKRYPRLVSVASVRSESPRADDPSMGDGTRYGGYLSQDDCRDLVQYAARRGVTIVPEIEMPGHATAALAAYPEMSNRAGEAWRVATTWGVKRGTYGVGEHVFEFIFNVLREVLDVFPSEFIHIGGDECDKTDWGEAADARRVMEQHHLGSLDEVQAYFIRRIDAWLTSQGRRLVGWDEILEGGLANGATVMSWRGVEGGVEAASRGHDVVMCPVSHCYLDYRQSDDPGEPRAIRGPALPLSKVYSYEPVPPALAPSLHHHVLGTQGNLWTEYIPTQRHLDYMAFPRLCAIAEVAWSPVALRDYAHFQRRLARHASRLRTAHGVTCGSAPPS